MGSRVHMWCLRVQFRGLGVRSKVLWCFSMSYKSFIVQGTPVSVAEVSGHTSMKSNGGALFAISQALYGLVGGLVKSPEEFQK